MRSISFGGRGRAFLYKRVPTFVFFNYPGDEFYDTLIYLLRIKEAQCSVHTKSTPRLKLFRRVLLGLKSLPQLRVAEWIPHPRGNSTLIGIIRAQGIAPISLVHTDHPLRSARLTFLDRVRPSIFTEFRTTALANFLVVASTMINTDSQNLAIDTATQIHNLREERASISQPKF
jgi:hypothetical protein